MQFSWTYLLQLISASLLVGRTVAVPTAEPELSRAIDARHGDEYLWYIDDAESRHLSDLLGTDFGRLRIKGVLLSKPKMQCENCGKHTGLDDIVHNALQDGVHSKEFMIKVLEDRTSHPSSGHVIRCSGAGCGRAYDEPPPRWTRDWIRGEDTGGQEVHSEGADEEPEA
ncbi:hypothetical protein BKA93DRAFT_829578 [Sparassis latifolia]